MAAGTRKRSFLSRLFFQDSDKHNNNFVEFTPCPHELQNIFNVGCTPEASDKWVQLTISAKGMKRILTLQSFPLFIGRADYPNGITLDDSSVSSRHAVINFENGGLTITDSDSKNGTFVNGRKLVAGEATFLARGEGLKIGRTEIIINDFQDGSNVYGMEYANATELLQDEGRELVSFAESKPEIFAMPYQDERISAMFCRNCGRKNAQQAKFCTGCGCGLA